MTVNFALVAWDQIVNHAAKPQHMFNGHIHVPMVIGCRNGFGRTAATHSQNFDGWFASVPGLKVVAPATPYDAKGLLKTAIRDNDPVIFLEHIRLYSSKGEVPGRGILVADWRERQEARRPAHHHCDVGAHGHRELEGRQDLERRRHRAGDHRPALVAAAGFVARA